MEKTLKDWMRRRYHKAMTITMGTLIMLLMNNLGFGNTIINPNETEEIIVTKEIQERSIPQKNALLFFNYFLSSNKNDRSKRQIEIQPIGPTDPVVPPTEKIIIWKNGIEISGLTHTTDNHVVTNGIDSGLMTKGGEIINNHTITLSSNNIGIIVNPPEGDTVDVSTGVNNGVIIGHGSGMLANHGVIINESNGTVSNSGDYGMIAVGSLTKAPGIKAIAINRGAIENKGTGGMIAHNGGTIVNDINGSIKNTGTSGIRVNGIDSIGINKGIIRNTNDHGMYTHNSGTITNEIGGSIKNSGNFGMSVDGNNSTGINKGTIANLVDHGINATNSATVTNDVGGSIKNSGNFGMSVNGNNSTGINKGTIANLVDHGIKATDSATVTNDVGGYIKNSGNFGMSVDGNNSTGINKGIIANLNNHGFTAINSGNITNDVKGFIQNNGDFGMKVDGNNSTGINKGIIANFKDYGFTAINMGNIINDNGAFIKNNGKFGMSVDGIGSTGINKGNIANLNDHGIAVTNSGTTINDVGAFIENNGNFGISVHGTDSTGINKGNIMNLKDYGISVTNSGTATNDTGALIQNNGNFGISVDGIGSTGINKGTIANIFDFGMFATNSGSITNEVDGIIKNIGNYGIKISDEGSTGTNKGKILNNGSYGLATINSGTITNELKASIKNKGHYGMSISGNLSNGINKGIIANKGQIGMLVIGEGATGINNGIIRNKSDYGTHVNNGGLLINDTNGIIKNKGHIGMYALDTDSKGVNKGLISNKGNFGMYARNGAIIKNEKGALIRNIGNDGMYIEGENTIAINSGTIANRGDFGMVNSKGLSITNDIDGLIKNKGTVGMLAYGESTTAFNKGIIANKSDYGIYGYLGIVVNDTGASIKNNGSYGMYADGENSSGTNKGTITNKGSYGMQANSGGTILNEEKAIIANKDNYGMKVDSRIDNLFKSTTAINNGTIDNKGLYGMQAIGSLATATNNGTINVTKDGTQSEFNYGMGAFDGATITNTGTINLLGNYQYGMYAAGTGSTLKNEGTINIGSGPDNVAVHLIDGATDITLYNTGAITSEGEFNTATSVEGGKLVMGSGGTIEAESIKGDIYASGALTMSGFDDKYDTYKMFKTDKIEGNIISNSTMFDANLTGKDKYGYYGVEMERKNFAEILDNQELAAILENNYVKEQNTTSSSTSKATSAKEDLYGALKLITSSETLGNAVDQTYGEFYSVTGKQTFDMIKSSNRVIRKNVLESDVVLAPGDAIFIGGANYSQLEEDNDDTLQKYNLDLSGVYFGGEKQLTKNMKVGVVATVGKLDIDYDENGTRNDMQYQANTYMKYKSASNVEYTSMFFAGMTTMETERTLAFTSLHEQMESNSENYYLGLHNSMSKKYFSTSGNNTYLKPKAELNFTYLMQGNISESGKYALDIDKSNSLSIETGLGVALGKDIYTKKGKLNLEIGATGYLELGKPYKDLNGKLSVLDGNATIKGYKGNNSYGDVLLGAKYISNSGVSIFADGGYEVGAHNKGWKTSAGVSFSF